jgi:hypothetical protein
MKLLSITGILATALLQSFAAPGLPAAMEPYNIVWDTPSKDATGSMPLSAGNLGLNVWIEGDDLLFYIGRPDSRVENEKLVKPGRVRLTLGSSPFRKKFRRETGSRGELHPHHRRECRAHRDAGRGAGAGCGRLRIVAVHGESRGGGLGMALPTCLHDVGGLWIHRARSHDVVADRDGRAQVRRRLKLQAPKHTTVECELRGGKIVKLEVTPASRKKDVEIIGPIGPYPPPPVPVFQGRQANASSAFHHHHHRRVSVVYEVKGQR